MKQQIACVLIFLLNLLPLKNNKIFLFSYYGSNFGCNPKYITNYILEHDSENKFDVVWAFNAPESKMEGSHIRKVKYMSLKYFYELCTSKVIITNCRTTELFVKRKNQYYIQTWHSSLRLKQIEKDAADTLPPDYIKMAKKDSWKCDLLLSGCRYSTNIFRSAFWYDGEIFEHGTPRNDILFETNRALREKIRRKLNISYQSNVLLYAPTFRKHDDMDIYHLDWESIINKLSGKFGNDWVVLVKLHPHLLNKSNSLNYGSRVIDVTAYDDIQELLLIADVLITDYSSLMFDFSIMKRPCFLYIPDINTYTKQERRLYFDVKKLPFIHAITQEALLEKIEAFNRQLYEESLTYFLKKIDSFEEGRANAFLFERMNEVCFGTQRREMDEAV